MSRAVYRLSCLPTHHRRRYKRFFPHDPYPYTMYILCNVKHVNLARKKHIASPLGRTLPSLTILLLTGLFFTLRPSRCVVVHVDGHQLHHTRGCLTHRGLHIGRLRHRADRLLHLLPDDERRAPDFQARHLDARHVKQFPKWVRTNITTIAFYYYNYISFRFRQNGMSPRSHTQRVCVLYYVI